MWYLVALGIFSQTQWKLMQWWASDENKKDDGVLLHPSDAKQWKDSMSSIQDFIFLDNE
jgi:hypothetical protein